MFTMQNKTINPRAFLFSRHPRLSDSRTKNNKLKESQLTAVIEIVFVPNLITSFVSHFSLTMMLHLERVQNVFDVNLSLFIYRFFTFSCHFLPRKEDEKKRCYFCREIWAIFAAFISKVCQKNICWIRLEPNYFVS